MYDLKKLALDAELQSIDPNIRNTLDVLIRDYEDHAKLNAIGKFLVYQGLSKRLKTRLSLEKLNGALPSFDQQGPIFVTGLPRSGTSYLFNLLHTHSNLRSPFTWEIFQANTISKNNLDVLIKKLKTRFELLSINRVVPDLKNIHPMHHDQPEECQLITAYDLKSISFAYSANLPNYIKVISNASFESSFRVHQMFLNGLSSEDGSTMWLLKDPCHIEHIDEILKVYPNAKFVFIHRHPKFSMPSISNLAYRLRLGFSNHSDKELVGQQMLSYWKNASEKLLDSRGLIPEDQMIDISFDHLVDDPFKTAHRILDRFAIPHDDGLRKKTGSRIENGKPKSRHVYSYGDFFKSAGEVESKFENYISFFDL